MTWPLAVEHAAKYISAAGAVWAVAWCVRSMFKSMYDD